MLTIPDEVIIKDKHDPAMKITDQKEADEYFEACVVHCMAMSGLPREEAEEAERVTLAHYAGYCDHETRLRVEKLFHCAHPFFGEAKLGTPTPEEAFQMGWDWAEGGDRCPSSK